METIKNLVVHAQEIVGAFGLVLSGLITISALIPGEQPEKFLRGIVSLIEKFSRK